MKLVSGASLHTLCYHSRVNSESPVWWCNVEVLFYIYHLYSCRGLTPAGNSALLSNPLSLPSHMEWGGELQKGKTCGLRWEQFNNSTKVKYNNNKLQQEGKNWWRPKRKSNGGYNYSIPAGSHPAQPWAEIGRSQTTPCGVQLPSIYILSMRVYFMECLLGQFGSTILAVLLPGFLCTCLLSKY